MGNVGLTLTSAYQFEYGKFAGASRQDFNKRLGMINKPNRENYKRPR